MSDRVPIQNQLSTRLKKQFRDSFFTLKYFHRSLSSLSSLIALNVPKDTFIDFLPVSYFVEIETQKTISKMHKLFTDMEDTIFGKVKEFVTEDEKQKILKKYEDDKESRAKKRRILMNYGNGDFEQVGSSTLDMYMLREAMDLLKTILADQVYSKENDSIVSSVQNHAEDELETSAGEERLGKIQNLELINNKGKGLQNENFGFDDWKKLRNFYDRIQGEVRCQGIPTTIVSSTEKAVQSKSYI